MTADEIAIALGGRTAGRGWMVRCPAHDDRTPSLAISTGDQGKVLVHCHAGCDQKQVIAALRARGLWNNAYGHQVSISGRHTRQIDNPAPARNDAKRTETALRLWQASSSPVGTKVESCLRSRGLHLPLPASLRFHAGLKHREGGVWASMVALVTRGPDDEQLAIHRTYLARDGHCKAPLQPQKMMLGPCRGGAVRLGCPGNVLMIGEGIETCLAAMQETGTAAWAALSASGLRALDLPPEAEEVIVLADGDDAGEASARQVALRWQREGRRVRIAHPPRGCDFNDLLLGCAPRIEEGAP